MWPCPLLNMSYFCYHCENFSENIDSRRPYSVRLNRSKRYVFTRDDFRDIAGYDQVGRALRTLVNEGKLMKVGYGVYTKARRNIITGKISPQRLGALLQ